MAGVFRWRSHRVWIGVSPLLLPSTGGTTCRNFREGDWRLVGWDGHLSFILVKQYARPGLPSILILLVIRSDVRGPPGVPKQANRHPHPSGSEALLEASAGLNAIGACISRMPSGLYTLARVSSSSRVHSIELFMLHVHNYPGP
ncbi:hypothetical protein BU26DRAFT_342390 [Trematosphaeria pertusa]|uniref:Uncharacterized protein n=1 Tax=Trematosphaeria pertusa TaxID=390896 RepID=A0A6A6I9S0_9PLEO|nr:uncharacterized protein BU26DRAFT_342390 [Trematosphaeria pertusa]KAF2247126.1 hypothetical protein BU26DRAFT_342390 [Trematosphaeria pertusa]